MGTAGVTFTGMDRLLNAIEILRSRRVWPKPSIDGLLLVGYHLFQAGDLLVFNMLTLHGSLDNQSPLGRVRLSCDVRYQPAEDPHDDPRYFGPRPAGSKGGGYGDMRGAQPLG